MAWWTFDKNNANKINKISFDVNVCYPHPLTTRSINFIVPDYLIALSFGCTISVREADCQCYVVFCMLKGTNWTGLCVRNTKYRKFMNGYSARSCFFNALLRHCFQANELLASPKIKRFTQIQIHTYIHLVFTLAGQLKIWCEPANLKTN